MSCSDDVTTLRVLNFCLKAPPADPRVDWRIDRHEHIMTMCPSQNDVGRNAPSPSNWPAEVPAVGSRMSNDGWSDEEMIVGFDGGEISAPN
jgi:hypothetical protein